MLKSVGRGLIMVKIGGGGRWLGEVVVLVGVRGRRERRSARSEMDGVRPPRE